MTDPCVAFAHEFDTRFADLTRGASNYEIPLFRAMHSALVGLSGQFEIEEYHGGSHQVTFVGNGSSSRVNSRCELSDLLIITYSEIARAARLTYLQAKSERATLRCISDRHFSANLEQWFLLSSRPTIAGVGAFNPPSGLLADALLPSVGSFAFFFKDPSDKFQIYYTVANYLIPPKPYSRRYGKLKAKGPCLIVSTDGYPECLSAFGNQSFAESLYRMEIGTPVDSSVIQALPTRNWLAANLRARIRKAEQVNKHPRLAQELLEVLAPEEDDAKYEAFGAKSLVIIKSEVETHRNLIEDA